MGTKERKTRQVRSYLAFYYASLHGGMLAETQFQRIGIKGRGRRQDRCLSVHKMLDSEIKMGREAFCLQVEKRHLSAFYR